MDTEERFPRGLQPAGKCLFQCPTDERTGIHHANGFFIKYRQNNQYRDYAAKKDEESAMGTYTNRLYIDLLSEKTLNYTGKTGNMTTPYWPAIQRRLLLKNCRYRRTGLPHRLYPYAERCNFFRPRRNLYPEIPYGNDSPYWHVPHTVMMRNTCFLPASVQMEVLCLPTVINGVTSPRYLWDGVLRKNLS